MTGLCPFSGRPADHGHHITGRDADGAYSTRRSCCHSRAASTSSSTRHGAGPGSTRPASCHRPSSGCAGPATCWSVWVNTMGRLRWISRRRPSSLLAACSPRSLTTSGMGVRRVVNLRGNPGTDGWHRPRVLPAYSDRLADRPGLVLVAASDSQNAGAFWVGRLRGGFRSFSPERGHHRAGQSGNKAALCPQALGPGPLHRDPVGQASLARRDAVGVLRSRC